MVDNKIENDINIQLMRLIEESLEIIKRTVLRINVIIIGNIVFVIRGRGHYGHEPYACKSKITDIFELIGCTLEITDAVTVRIRKGIDENFIPVADIIIRDVFL